MEQQQTIWAKAAVNDSVPVKKKSFRVQIAVMNRHPIGIIYL